MQYDTAVLARMVVSMNGDPQHRGHYGTYLLQELGYNVLRGLRPGDYRVLVYLGR